MERLYALPQTGGLDEALAHPPLVLAEQHALELAKRIGWIVEYSQDRLTLGNRQREDLRLEAEGDLDPCGVFEVGIAEQSLSRERRLRGSGCRRAALRPA
ncbi:MAG TPA: hypothetical protein VD766_05220 [Solirubrobacterales bacterium]|nr:hypothetical protein [Solirubrobacterales bacterium]